MRNHAHSDAQNDKEVCMFRRTIGYAAVLAACLTIGRASSAGALIVAPPIMPIISLGTVDGCQVTLSNTSIGTVTNNGTTTRETVGTCNVSGGGVPCPAPAEWELTGPNCVAAVRDVCNNGACIWGVPGIPEVGPCLDTTC